MRGDKITAQQPTTKMELQDTVIAIWHYEIGHK